MATSIECVAIRGFKNQGSIKKLDGDYYQVVLGVLEYPNSIGAYYDTASAEKVLESPAFKRKVLDGNLRGEWGHPKEEDYPKEIDYIRRIHQIFEDKVCFHIRKVDIDKNYRLPSGQTVVAFIGEVRGSGIHFAAFERMMNNPHENVCFSVRSMATDRVVGGKLKKFFDNIITWDLVTEPGLKPSTKFNSPSCESYDSGIQDISTFVSKTVTLETIERAMETPKGKLASNESGFYDLKTARDILKRRNVLKKGSALSDWR